MSTYARLSFLSLNVLLAVVLLLQGCEDTQAPQSVMPTVTYMQVNTQSVTLTTELSGRTSAFMVSEVRPQVSGIIQQRLFVEGSDVKQGEVLYQIDPSLYQAAFDNAKATLEKAAANEVAARLLAERYKEVVRVNAVSKQEYDNAVAAHGQALAEVSAAKAALDTASINLAYTRVISPVSGRIGRSSVTPGALVTQNQPDPLATVQQLDPMYVDVTQSSTDLLRLKRAFESGQLKSSGEGAMLAALMLEDGTPYTVRVPKKDQATGAALKDELGQPVFEQRHVIGSLKFSEVTVEQSTGVVTIRAVFPNPEGTLLPGMYVRAVLEEGVNDKAIIIPQRAMIRNNRGLPTARVLTRDEEGGPDVFMVTTRVLTVDRVINGDSLLVTDGLKEGDLLMVDGIMKLQAGKPVKGVLEQPAALETSAPQGSQEQPAAPSANAVPAAGQSGKTLWTGRHETAPSAPAAASSPAPLARSLWSGLAGQPLNKAVQHGAVLY